MEELKTVAELANAGGNAALMLCAFYIYQSTKAYNRVAERLAGIEAILQIKQSNRSE